ncbi:putative RNA-directed DNA polymerase from transposon BS [Trichonephila clavipes]|nr:putative RNA-directed DNA polymerase from transposon BS [Trichonephila clavipes]
MTSPDEIWILCDSRSAIQHLSDWTNVGDKTSVSILKNLKELSQQHEIYFQWIPSHIGLFGNDTADLLAKEGVTENLMSRRTLTFSEIFSKTKSLIQELWKTPPTHPWYNRQAPGGALSIKADRVVQTTISRLASGHIRGLSFSLGQKIYENCTKCNLVQATPDHLLFCAGLEREDIYSSPLLVYDFLRTLGLMDLSPKPTGRSSAAKAEYKVTVMASMMLLCTLTAWTPYAVVSLMVSLGYDYLLGPVSSVSPAIFAKTSVVYNPIVYFFFNTQHVSALASSRDPPKTVSARGRVRTQEGWILSSTNSGNNSLHFWSLKSSTGFGIMFTTMHACAYMYANTKELHLKGPKLLKFELELLLTTLRRHQILEWCHIRRA